MRIVGGQWGGHRLHAPSGKNTRPTSDALRETIFNILHNSFGHELGHVLDLFSGTGALAFEALSRGAQTAVVIESDPKALAALERNRQELKLEAGQLELVRENRVRQWHSSLAKVVKARGAPFDTIFCDPPYDKGLVASALRGLELQGSLLFAPQGCLVAEQSSREDSVELKNWEIIDDRKRGVARLVCYRRKETVTGASDVSGDFLG